MKRALVLALLLVLSTVTSVAARDQQYFYDDRGDGDRGYEIPADEEAIFVVVEPVSPPERANPFQGSLVVPEATVGTRVRIVNQLDASHRVEGRIVLQGEVRDPGFEGGPPPEFEGPEPPETLREINRTVAAGERWSTTLDVVIDRVGQFSIQFDSDRHEEEEPPIRIRSMRVEALAPIEVSLKDRGPDDPFVAIPGRTTEVSLEVASLASDPIQNVTLSLGGVWDVNTTIEALGAGETVDVTFEKEWPDQDLREDRRRGDGPPRHGGGDRLEPDGTLRPGTFTETLRINGSAPSGFFQHAVRPIEAGDPGPRPLAITGYGIVRTGIHVVLGGATVGERTELSLYYVIGEETATRFDETMEITLAGLAGFRQTRHVTFSGGPGEVLERTRSWTPPAAGHWSVGFDQDEFVPPDSRLPTTSVYVDGPVRLDPQTEAQAQLSRGERATVTLDVWAVEDVRIDEVRFASSQFPSQGPVKLSDLVGISVAGPGRIDADTSQEVEVEVTAKATGSYGLVSVFETDEGTMVLNQGIRVQVPVSPGAAVVLALPAAVVAVVFSVQVAWRRYKVR